MAHEAETDHGTVLEKNSWAAIWHPEHGYSLMTPKMEPDAAVAPEALALLGAFIRLDNDPEFRQECETWVRKQKQ